MGVGTALRRIVGLQAKSRALSAADGRDAPVWSRLLGYGDNASGKVVTPDTAMQVATVWSCVRLLSETIATLPLVVYERRDDDSRVVARSHPLSTLLRVSPDGEHTAVEFIEGLIISLCLNGHAFGEKIRSANGRLVAIHPMLFHRTTVRRLDDGSWQYRYNDPVTRTVRILSEDDVFHVRGFGNGLSPIAFARQTIGASIAADEAAGRLFANGVRPSGVLEVGQVLKPEQRKDLRENIVAPLAGSQNAGGVFVLEAGMKFSQISLSPADSELLATRRWHVEEICRWFMVPPILIGHAAQGQTMWGSGVEQINLGWLSTGLRNWLNRIEAAILLRLFMPGERGRYYAEFNIDGLLRADSKSRSELFARRVQNGLMSRNEARRLDNLPPYEGGDSFTVQSNLLPVDMLGKVAVQPNEKPIGGEDGATQEQ
ncbi:phage portal protein [Methylobacterium sp. NMS12]|uniref:phage portal protein n=1 Tax=Methylobacterium sp. NMS12 TaxID=3079766 RepID=UPI003F884805